MKLITVFFLLLAQHVIGRVGIGSQRSLASDSHRPILDDEAFAYEDLSDYVCPNTMPRLFDNAEGVRCETNTDCAGIDGACCIFPSCICGVDGGIGGKRTCVTEEDFITSEEPRRRSRSRRRHLDDGEQATCPTGYFPESLIESNPSLTGCLTDADCANITSPDGQTCCIFPQCICGVASATESSSVTCVGDPLEPTGSPVVFNQTTMAPMVTEATAAVNFTPSDSSMSPEPSASPAVFECLETNYSISFQFDNPSLKNCTINADCEGVTTVDGPTCCIQPQCICGVSTAGADRGVGCVSDPEPILSDPPSVLDRTQDTPDADSGDIAVGTPSPTPEMSQCVDTAFSIGFQQANPSFVTCTTDGDCVGVTVSDGEACCLHPLCVCDIKTAAESSALTCVSDLGAEPPVSPAPTARVSSRTDNSTSDDDDDFNIDVESSSPSSASEASVMPSSTPEASTASSGSTFSCPSGRFSESYALANPSLTSCTTNQDCIGVEFADGPACCIFPQCVCGVSSATESSSVFCVDGPIPESSLSTEPSDAPSSDVPDRTDGGDSPTGIVFVEQQATCETDISPLYWANTALTPCLTNEDCADVELFGGGIACCIHPQCICGDASAPDSPSEVVCVGDSILVEVSNDVSP